MTLKLEEAPSAVVMEKFVTDMHELYIDEYRKFLRDAAEVAIEEAADAVRKRLKVRAASHHSYLENAPLVTVLLEIHGNK